MLEWLLLYDGRIGKGTFIPKTNIKSKEWKEEFWEWSRYYKYTCICILLTNVIVGLDSSYRKKCLSLYLCILV